MNTKRSQISSRDEIIWYIGDNVIRYIFISILAYIFANILWKLYYLEPNSIEQNLELKFDILFSTVGYMAFLRLAKI